MSDKTMHEAFLEAYGEMPDPKKNADNPAFKRKDGSPMRYADLEAFLDVAKPILVASGFALIQEPVSDGPLVGIHTWLLYKTGESMDFGQFTVALSKPDPQGAGAALTYCRRYAVAAIFGLAQEDDDANRASNTPQTKTATQIGSGIGDDAPIVRAIFGKKKALGMTDKALENALKRDYGVSVVKDLTMPQAKDLADKMQAAIEKAEEPEEPATVTLLDEDIPF